MKRLECGGEGSADRCLACSADRAFSTGGGENRAQGRFGVGVRPLERYLCGLDGGEVRGRTAELRVGETGDVSGVGLSSRYEYARPR